MSRHERIILLLTSSLKPTRIELHDDSYKHAGHSGARDGGQTHYDLVIEAESFKGMSKVARHQAIYRLLSTEFNDGLHALSIKALAPGEN